ncbi:MAG: ArsR family transcriptional regulator, partial [Clostridia bacterium]
MAKFIFNNEVDCWREGFDFAFGNYTNIDEAIVGAKKRGYTAESLIVAERARKYFDVTLPSIQEVTAEYPLFNKYSKLVGYEKDNNNRVLYNFISSTTEEEVSSCSDTVLTRYLANFVASNEPFIDRADLINKLNFGKYPSSIKRKCIDIYDEREELLEEIKSLGKRLKVIVSLHLDLLQNEIENTVALFSTGDILQKGLHNFLDTNILTDDSVFEVYPLVSGFNGVEVAIMQKKAGRICIGVWTEELFTEKTIDKTDTLRIARMLKAISDVSRIQIIKLLAKSPTYLQKLSEVLSLTPATVSHHLQMLLNE